MQLVEEENKKKSHFQNFIHFLSLEISCSFVSSRIYIEKERKINFVYGMFCMRSVNKFLSPKIFPLL